MAEITIATSITPRNFELQRAAIDSWLKLGFKVISLNSAAEAVLVAQGFPDIPLIIVKRTAESSTGKPYVFFDDVCNALTESGADICGIVNSDIFLYADAMLADFVSETARNSFLFGSRIDIDALEHLDGEKYIYGFDFFFCSKNILKLFPESGFCLGVPWWDYWAPFVPMLKGVSCKELISPVAFHLKHETKWAGELFSDYCSQFADKVSQLAPDSAFTGRITSNTSPEQLTVFSFDILQHILQNSNKVMYPPAKEESMRIEVGRSQYLKMREQVIELHKKTMELRDQIWLSSNALNLRNDEVEQLRSSLSWRLMKPLRWLGDKIRW